MTDCSLITLCNIFVVDRIDGYWLLMVRTLMSSDRLFIDLTNGTEIDKRHIQISQRFPYDVSQSVEKSNRRIKWCDAQAESRGATGGWVLSPTTSCQLEKQPKSWTVFFQSLFSMIRISWTVFLPMIDGVERMLVPL